MHWLHRWFLFVLLGLVAGPAAAATQQPLEALKMPIEQVLELLSDPQYQDAAKKNEQSEKIRAISRNIFDYTEIAKRALARNWRTFTPQQRKAFTEAFTDLLENNYIKRVQGKFQDEKVLYLGQEMISDTKAVVKTKIQRKEGDVAANYNMHLDDGSWRVYDIYIEGISLIKNYRTQFNSILLNDSPDQLIERVKSKTDIKD